MLQRHRENTQGVGEEPPMLMQLCGAATSGASEGNMCDGRPVFTGVGGKMKHGAPSKTLDLLFLAGGRWGGGGGFKASSVEGVEPAVVTNKDVNKSRCFVVLKTSPSQRLTTNTT